MTGLSRFGLVLGLVVSAAALASACGESSHAPIGRVSSPIVSASVVISQVYTHGGQNAPASFTNDYVELFNMSTTTVDISG